MTDDSSLIASEIAFHAMYIFSPQKSTSEIMVYLCTSIANPSSPLFKWLRDDTLDLGPDEIDCSKYRNFYFYDFLDVFFFSALDVLSRTRWIVLTCCVVLRPYVQNRRDACFSGVPSPAVDWAAAIGNRRRRNASLKNQSFAFLL